MSTQFTCSSFSLLQCLPCPPSQMYGSLFFNNYYIFVYKFNMVSPLSVVSVFIYLGLTIWDCIADKRPLLWSKLTSSLSAVIGYLYLLTRGCGLVSFPLPYCYVNCFGQFRACTGNHIVVISRVQLPCHILNIPPHCLSSLIFFYWKLTFSNSIFGIWFLLLQFLLGPPCLHIHPSYFILKPSLCAPKGHASNTIARWREVQIFIKTIQGCCEGHW